MDGRKRIAAEVHDGIGQSLSARKYSLENEVKKLQSQGHGETLKGLEVVALASQAYASLPSHWPAELNLTSSIGSGTTVEIYWPLAELRHLSNG